MKAGDTILILPSFALQSMRMDKLAGMKAKVVEVVKKESDITGCWVTLPCQFLGSNEWFIPYNSIGQ